jgi:hypothetical protein
MVTEAVTPMGDVQARGATATSLLPTPPPPPPTLPKPVVTTAVARARAIADATNHQVKPSRKPRPSVKCLHCLKEFYSNFNLSRHVQSVHNKGAKTARVSPNKTLKRSATTPTDNPSASKASKKDQQTQTGGLCEYAFDKAMAIQPFELFAINLWLDPSKGLYFCTVVPKS